MRRVEFDYPNSCPKIDKAIEQAKRNIYGFINDLLDEACPLLPAARRDELATDYADRLYRDLEDGFETVRSTNEDMRRAADSQISDLMDKLNDVESELERHS